MCDDDGRCDDGDDGDGSDDNQQWRVLTQARIEITIVTTIVIIIMVVKFKRYISENYNVKGLIHN